jgi:hypothetical protein
VADVQATAAALAAAMERAGGPPGSGTGRRLLRGESAAAWLAALTGAQHP